MSGFIGEFYVPYLLANAKVSKKEAVRVTSEWVSEHTPYQVKALSWLNRDYNSLSDAEKASIASLLLETKCMPLFLPLSRL